MKNLPLMFCGIFFMLAFSWSGLILSSLIQLRDLEPITMEEGGQTYPRKLPGIAMQGKQVYQELGCMYCHSQQTRRANFGADYERNWGNRQSVARDYILQERVLLGTMRTGPDLMNVGVRLPDATWHHLHLYNPQITSPGSTMPPYRFLYRMQKIGDQPSPDALSFPPADPDRPIVGLPPEGYEVVPTDRAKALVAYLQNLRLDYSLPEAPLKD